MVVRPIHNLGVPGSNPEVGHIFSERYLARKGVEKKKRIGRNCEGDLGLERVGKIILFSCHVILNLQPKI